MYQLGQIFRFHFAVLFKNKWVHLGCIPSIVFTLLYSAGLFYSDRNMFTWVIDYRHTDMVMPFIVLFVAVWTFANISREKTAALLDTYDFKNVRLYAGVYLSIFTLFAIYAFAQFSIFWVGRFVITGDPAYWKSIWFFVLFTIPNLFLFIAVGAFVGSVFTEGVAGFLLVFGYKFFDLVLDNFTVKTFALSDLLHSNIFKYTTFSDFGLMGIDSLIPMINRIFVICIGTVFVSLGLLVFKQERERRGKWLYITVGVVALLACVFFANRYRFLQQIPAEQVTNKAVHFTSEILPLDFSHYVINGEIHGQQLKIRANFQVQNHGDTPHNLCFYLAENFLLSDVRVNGAKIPFQRKGEMITCEQILQPAEARLCRVEYAGTMEEYAIQKEIFGYRIYAKIGSEMTFLPARMGWYPQVEPIYPTTPNNAVSIKPYLADVQILGDYPIIADKNLVYGYPNLAETVYDGIRYCHLKSHQPSIEALHRFSKDKILFMNELMPLPVIRVLEVPQNILVPERLGKGCGLIFLDEKLILRAKVGDLMESDLRKLDQAIFNAWFELAGESSMFGKPEGNYLPLELFLYYFIDYLYQSKNNPQFAADHYVEEIANRWGRPDFWVKLIEYYKFNGLSRTRQLLRSFLNIAQERRLNESDFYQLLR